MKEIGAMDRDEAYSALSDLIYKGFLTAELNLEGKLLIFKTVNEKEYDLIKVYSGNPNSFGYGTRFNIYFLIFSLFAIDNQNVLYTRNQNIKELYDYFFNLPDYLIKRTLKHLNSMRLMAYEALKFLEGFCYTGQSRSAWKALNGKFPSSVEFTGIPGTTDLGMSLHQESWVIINRSLDSEEDYNKDFSLSLMVASSSNPKGSRHIRNQFDSNKKMAEDRRKKLALVGFIDTQKWTPDGWASSVDTAEELVAELERQMNGVKDKHDLFIEKYMDQIRVQAEKNTKEAEERIIAAQQGRDNVFIDGEQRAMTPEEMKSLMGQKVLTTETVPEQVITPEDKNKFYSKIGSRILTGK